ELEGKILEHEQLDGVCILGVTKQHPAASPSRDGVVGRIYHSHRRQERPRLLGRVTLPRCEGRRLSSGLAGNLPGRAHCGSRLSVTIRVVSSAGPVAVAVTAAQHERAEDERKGMLMKRRHKSS